jgi:hypothetical protein
MLLRAILHYYIILLSWKLHLSHIFPSPIPVALAQHVTLDLNHENLDGSASSTPREYSPTTVQPRHRQVASTGLYFSMLRFSLANRPVLRFFHSGSPLSTPRVSLMRSSITSPDSIIASRSRSILSRSVAEKLCHASCCACSLFVMSLLILNRMRPSIVLTSRAII